MSYVTTDKSLKVGTSSADNKRDKEQTMTSELHRNDAGNNENEHLNVEYDGEQIVQQFQAVLNSGDMEACCTQMFDATPEPNELDNHQSVQAEVSDEVCKEAVRADMFQEVNDPSANTSEMLIETKPVGKELEARADQHVVDNDTFRRKLQGGELAEKSMASKFSDDMAGDTASDMDDSEAFNTNTSSCLPARLSSSPAASTFSQPSKNNAKPEHVPDVISSHKTPPPAVVQPSYFVCASAESMNLMERCAHADNDDCPKRDAAIFTELVADVGGCLCSRGDLRQRLPPGWPHVFHPLPDLIASQQSFESKNQSGARMTLGKTILVTGGAGYVGSHAVIELVTAGYDIVVVDNLVNASMESIRRVEKIVGKKITSYSVDLLNKAALGEIFTKHSVDAVIHFAGLKAVGESCEVPLLYYKNNVGGTTNLLEVMQAHGVYNLVFSSSATVYGTPQFLPLTESHPVGGCTSPYGKTKHMVEEMLCDIAASNQSWNFIILRYFNPVGAHPSGTIGEDPLGLPNNLMPFIGQVAVGRRAQLKVYGSDYDTPDGTGVRDYIHVVDLAKGHVAALRKLEECCGIKVGV